MFTKVVESDKKIVGGQIAEPHSIPFQAAILVKHENAVAFCGGSIINERTVLTAAHCVKNSQEAIVILGAHDLAANESTILQRRVNSSTYRLHPEFSFTHANMDIALILLPTAVNFSEAIKPIKLPSGYLFDESFSGETGTVSGFGQVCDNCSSSHLLRFTTNRVMSNEDCSKAFGFISSVPSESQICLSTAENKSGSCRGDSGGPLTILRNGEHLQIGISSFGYKKCEEGQPTVFTRLTRELISWIHKESQ